MIEDTALILLFSVLQKTLPVFPAAGQSQIKVINLGTDNATVWFEPQIQSVNVTSMESVSKGRWGIAS